MIKSIRIKNYKLFSSKEDFVVNDFNIPDKTNEGSGLTIFVGENGCGKTTLLDALALPYVSYKADSYSLTDLNDFNIKTEIEIFSDMDFEYNGTMPKAKYYGKGFVFSGGIRSQGSNQYFSKTVVFDQKVIRADGKVKPIDDSPDLRLSVNNPFSGSRFDKIEYLILDKNRTYQTKKGTFNDTRFDRLMEDLNFRYLKDRNKNNSLDKVHTAISDLKLDDNLSNLESVFDKFNDVSGNTLKLNIIDILQPYLNANFGVLKENHQTITLNQLGSGYEMIFSLIYAIETTKKTKKSLIVLIDEPELHLHPKLQLTFISLLLEYSKDAQIFISTHSPLLVKQAMMNEFVNVKVLNKIDNKIVISAPQDSVLSYKSANEVNYIAFEHPTEEYHNELYEELKTKYGEKQKLKDYDNDYFIKLKGEEKTSPWLKNPNQVSMHTFIRNQIHHRADNGEVQYNDLKSSIEKLRQYLTEKE